MLTAAGEIGRRRPGFLVLTLQGSVLASHASVGSERRVFRPASTMWTVSACAFADDLHDAPHPRMTCPTASRREARPV